MDDTVVVVGGGHGVGRTLAARLLASVTPSGREVTVIDTPELFVTGHIGRGYVPVVESHHLRLSPTMRGRKHWHEVQAFCHEMAKTWRKREIQSARRLARRAMRRASK